jgi:hypothetical protein
MDRLVKELKGHSGSKVLLMQNDSGGHFVRKIGNVERNVERYKALAGITNVPTLYKHDLENDVLDMQYIHGLDMMSYLLYEGIDPLISFLVGTIKQMSQKGSLVDYREVYAQKLEEIDFAPFGFSKSEFMGRAPVELPQSIYHGDFTLENVLFSEVENKFYLIDPLTSEYDSYAFDLGKLQQDIRCGWFIRDRGVMLGSKLRKIYNALSEEFDLMKDQSRDNDMLVIAMLLRVYPYCATRTDREFIVKNVRKLWK